MIEKLTLSAISEEFDDHHKALFRLTQDLPERVKNSFMELEGVENIKENIGDPYFEKINPKFRKDLMICRNFLRNAYFSIISAYSVLSDVEICAKMINRYPWHGTKISKSEHFSFVWSSFVNHCYIFEARTKQIGKHLNDLSKHYGGDSIKAGKWIKKIDKEIGEHTAFRGAHVHVWSRVYKNLEHFALMDSVATMDKKYQSDEYRSLLKWKYGETKNNLKNEILNTRKKMIKILLELEPDPIDLILRYCLAFDKLLEENEISDLQPK